MKKIFILIIITLTFILCRNRTENRAFCPAVDNLVSEFIKKSPQAPIIFLTFSNLNGKDILFMSDGYVYDKRKVDYFLKRDGRLIIVYSTDYRSREDFFCKDSMTVFRDTIVGYMGQCGEGKYLYESNHMSKTETYQLIRRDSIMKGVPKPSSKYRAKDNNVILSVEANHIINAYINSHSAVLYLLKFKEINGYTYMGLVNAQFYDMEGFDGYFFRNNHIVAVFNSSDSNSLIGNGLVRDRIKGIKQAPLYLDWLINKPICYCMEKNGRMRKVRKPSILYEVFIR